MTTRTIPVRVWCVAVPPGAAVGTWYATSKDAVDAALDAHGSTSVVEYIDAVDCADRVAALEAVVEAAKLWTRRASRIMNKHGAESLDSHEMNLLNAVTALAALDAGRT